VRTIARKRQADPAAPHVIICGAGFGGLSAIRGLTRAGLRVTLIDGHLYSTFQPLLYQVATGGLNPGDVAYPAGGFVRRYEAVFRRGELAAIDPASRRIKLADGRDFGYDYLIVAAGVTTAFYGVEGAADNTFGLYTRTDAIVLRDHLMAGFERLSEEDGDLHVTVVGGGATGVELVGTLAELRRTVLASTFPDVDPARVRVQLIEMSATSWAVPREAARVRQGPAGGPRRRRAAGHPHQRGHPGPRQARSRRGPAQRHHRVGGRRGGRPGRGGLGPAAGQERPHRGRP
jgi:NADH dehydrogenase